MEFGIRLGNNDIGTSTALRSSEKQYCDIIKVKGYLAMALKSKDG